MPANPSREFPASQPKRPGRTAADGELDLGEAPSEEPHRAVAVGMTNEGRVRDLNEDTWRLDPLSRDLALFAVADGMGGHDRGEVASSVAVETLFDETRAGLDKLETYSVESLAQALLRAFQQANRAVVECGKTNDSNMGTTLCTALMYRESEVFVANVGDSRGYVLRNGHLTQVTRDHSLVAYLVQMGELTREQARTHPSGNILVRSVGSANQVEVDLFYFPVYRGDKVLLCSDGLWGEIPDDDIRRVLQESASPEAACRALIDLANHNGGKDNITVIVIEI